MRLVQSMVRADVSPLRHGGQIAVIGSGISGLSAAWLLSQRYAVTLYEQEARIGGHANTVQAVQASGHVPIDTGFIVFNPKNYPNLTALFDYFCVETAPSDMSFSVSLDDGALEYGGAGLDSLFAQRRNLLRPRFWSMVRDLLRFYRTAPDAIRAIGSSDLALGDFLAQQGYSRAFVQDHLLPMAGAIWSAAPEALNAYPAEAFIRFFENHGLLELTDRPPWRTVRGGSVQYVLKILREFKGEVRSGAPVRAVHRGSDGVRVTCDGDVRIFDRVLIATHANDALAMLEDATPAERTILGAFRYTRNSAVLHSDPALMPKRKKVWSSWNYLARSGNGERDIQVTYWMNALQPLATKRQFFVTLNPMQKPAEGTIVKSETYFHPLFDSAALKAQRQLHLLQGQHNTWFCGAHFGSGFHEDGLKSGLDAAEAMGSLPRPWALPIKPAAETSAVREPAQ